jgi:hypothetical protein
MFSVKRLAAAAAVALSVSACSDSLSPDAVNTDALANDVNSLNTLIEGNAAYQAMQDLSFYFPSFGATNLVRASMPQAPKRLLGTGGLMTVPRVARPQLSPEDIQALFPVDALGKTYVWNVNTDQYENTGPAGAPNNGIRITIYTVNPSTNQPVEPLQALGYLELTDEPTAQSENLGVRLTLGNSTIADYLITAITGTNTFEMLAAGYLLGSAGSGRVDFDIRTFENYQTGASEFEYELAQQGGATIVIDFAATSNGGTGLIRVSRGENSVEVTWSETSTSFTGQVKFNGTVVANVTQQGENDPVFTGANGRQLSAQQQADIEEMFDGVLFIVFVALYGILAPAYVVF